MTQQPTRPATESGIEPRRVLTLVLALVALTILGYWRHRAMVDDTIHDFSGATMGTSWSARVDAYLSGRGREATRRLIQDHLDSLDRMLSSYDPESELSRFNRHVSTEPFPVSADLLRALVAALGVSALSNGAFDVTVAPYVDA